MWQPVYIMYTQYVQEKSLQQCNTFAAPFESSVQARSKCSETYSVILTSFQTGSSVSHSNCRKEERGGQANKEL